MAASDGTQLKVTQIRSSIGIKPKQRGTLRALGLRGIGQTNTLPDRPEIRGMLAKVPHLVTVSLAEQSSNSKGSPAATKEPQSDTATPEGDKP
jgi:large subunit ribosomal protein L30